MLEFLKPAALFLTALTGYAAQTVRASCHAVLLQTGRSCVLTTQCDQVLAYGWSASKHWHVAATLHRYGHYTHADVASRLEVEPRLDEKSPSGPGAGHRAGIGMNPPVNCRPPEALVEATVEIEACTCCDRLTSANVRCGCCDRPVCRKCTRLTGGLLWCADCINASWDLVPTVPTSPTLSPRLRK